MLEKNLKVRVLRWLSKEYPDAFVWKISDQWRSGLPDLFILVNRNCYFIELKSDRGKLTRLQTHTLAKLHMAGAKCCVARSLEEVKILMRGGE